MNGLGLGQRRKLGRRVRRTLDLVLSVGLVALMISGAAVRVSAGVTAVTLDGPGIYGEDDDYFTTVWGSPRDMDDADDLYLLYSSCGNHPARAMWSSTWFSDGIWHGRTSDVGETRYVFVLNPGWVSSLDLGEDGELRPIDTSYYRQLTFRMRVSSNAGGLAPRIHWANNPIGGGEPNPPWYFEIQSDDQWHVYTFNLGSNPAWTSGPVSSLWFQLESLNANALVEIDWIRLTPRQNRRIRWVGTALPGKEAKVYLGPASSSVKQYGDLLIYDGRAPRWIDAGAGELVVPASYPGDVYRARVETTADGATSADTWTFAPTPIAGILAPSYTSGEDFSTAVVGNPWDMAGMNDVDVDTTEMDNIRSLSTAGGVLTIVTQDDGMDSCAEPWPHRPLGLNLGDHRIDTAKYRYLTWRYKVDNLIDQGAGGMHRARWQARHLPYWPTGRTDDISFYNSGWRTYSVDLPNVELEAEYGAWGDPDPDRYFEVDVMQIMIHESHREWTSHLDWVKLTAENVARASYTVQWDVINSSRPMTTTLYWAEKSGSAYQLVLGTEHVIPGSVPPLEHKVYAPALLNDYGSAVPEHLSHEMSATGLDNGQRYYVAIQLDDGYSVSWWYSEVPVLKQ